MGVYSKRQEMGEKKWAEYQKKRKNAKILTYRKKNADKVVNWRRRVKIKLMEHMGGKCEICGYNKNCPSSYTFHHINPSEKSFSIGGKTLAFGKLKMEADKCQLLCRNCHGEIHDEKYKKQREETIKKWEKQEKKRKKNDHKKNKQCPICNLKFRAKNVITIYCSLKCALYSKRKIKDRPSKEQLLKEIEGTNYCVVGRKYGVSDNSIRKWIK